MARTLRLVLVLSAALVAPAGALADPDSQLEDEVRARDDRIEALERTVEILASELERVRVQVAVPEESELMGSYGLGPAASKIYGLERGLSLGGYGEALYTNFVNDTAPGQRDRADFLRLVTYIGYRFSESIVFNSEIEFEHATTEPTVSSDGGSVSVEFAALDFFWKDWMNARTGLLLLPMGYLNEVHEPPFYYGVRRPETERRILPSTWRENGVGVFGRIGEDLAYRSYVVTGFNAAGFSDAGIRGGRQNGDEALAEDLAWVTRLDWTPLDGLELGGSFYTGRSGQDGDGPNGSLPGARLNMGELHAQYRRGPLHTRALFALSHLGNAGRLNRVLDRPQDAPIAERMFGGYVELAYDVWDLLFPGRDWELAPFFRVEYVDTQDEVPGGFSANREQAFWLYTPGLQFKPHPNVVLKMEYRNFQARAGELADEVSLGMGFAF
jgi:opacity protein-like surface antigen